MLTCDDPPARVTIEFGPKAFQHGFSRFFDLKERRGAVAACEKTNCTERSHAADPDWRPCAPPALMGGHARPPPLPSDSLQVHRHCGAAGGAYRAGGCRPTRPRQAASDARYLRVFIGALGRDDARHSLPARHLIEGLVAPLFKEVRILRYRFYV